MAEITSNTPVAAGALTRALAPLRVLSHWADTVASARAAADEIERLSRMSDAALAERGIARDEITARAVARHFRD